LCLDKPDAGQTTKLPGLVQYSRGEDTDGITISVKEVEHSCGCFVYLSPEERTVGCIRTDSPIFIICCIPYGPEGNEDGVGISRKVNGIQTESFQNAGTAVKKCNTLRTDVLIILCKKKIYPKGEKDKYIFFHLMGEIGMKG